MDEATYREQGFAYRQALSTAGDNWALRLQDAVGHLQRGRRWADDGTGSYAEAERDYRAALDTAEKCLHEDHAQIKARFGVGLDQSAR